MPTETRAARRPERPARKNRRDPEKAGRPIGAAGRAPSSHLRAAAVLTGSLLLASCGGDGGGPGIAGSVPAPEAVTYHQVTDPLTPGAYAFSGAFRDAIRIGIEDTPVDFTHPHFHGRVQLEGAGLVYWRPLASYAAQRAFASCGQDGHPCRVFKIDSRGDQARLRELARTVIEHAGLPAAGDRWFLHDRSGGNEGWYELPSAEDLVHGTTVASVAIGRRFHPFPAPDPVIVPMAFNFDEQLEVQHYFSDLVAEARSNPRALADLDRRHGEELRRKHRAADIINASYGVSVDLNSLRGRNVLRQWQSDLELLRDRSPLTWGEYVQRTTPESGRTIRVWAAGNHEPETGVPASGAEGRWFNEFPNVLADDGFRNLDSIGPYHFPELRGQHIRVTALSTDEERLAPYADPCGPRPPGWSEALYGKHYCLAAPGTLSDDVQGTSFAAPFVSGLLARMMRRFPGVTPRELVRKLMDTADGYREAGFDGGIYVVQRQLRDPDSDELVDRIVDIDENGGVTNRLTLETEDPTHPPAEEGEYRVAQRGCAASGSDYLAWTGEAEVACIVWRSGSPVATTPRQALEKAEERFAFVYGAGRVDVDAALAPAGTTRISAPGVPPTPVASTRLRAPAAWGAFGNRVSGLSLAAFDALDFPFFHRLDEFVADAHGGSSSPIPEFLPEPARTRACDPLRKLAPGLLCAPWMDDAPVQALASPSGAGATFRLGEGLLATGFVRDSGRLDGAGSGVFSFGGGSSLAALRLDRAWTPAEADHWRFDGSLTFAADLPRGPGVASPSLLAAGTTLVSEWSFGLTRASGTGRTRISLAQPPRAEAGHGRFTLPSGRREDGTRLHATHRVSLVPSHRELTLRLSHQRPVPGGELVLSVHRTENPGHRAARPEHGAGMAWRAKW